jgi:hypothetical protein
MKGNYEEIIKQGFNVEEIMKTSMKDKDGN